MNFKDIEKAVAAIEGQLFKNSNSLSIGMLKSHFRGSGIQFKEHQVYNPGDDVRFIDWKLSAKTNTTYVKTFEEDRNVDINVVLDITPTMFMGYKGVSKLQASIEMACLLYLLAEKTKDKVTVIIFCRDKVILPAAIGHQGMALLISQLEKMNILTEKGTVNLSYELDKPLEEKQKFNLLKSLIGRRKEVVYLSDFSEIEDFNTFEKFCYRPTMHCFRVISPIDELSALPFSIYTRKGKRKSYMRVFSDKDDLNFTGRYKKVNVKDRYLDVFVREML